MMGEVIRVSGRAPDVGDLLREAMVSQKFADVALCCSGGQRFLAHRLVLSAASPYLQDVLLAHGKASGYSEPITIILAEVEGPELSAILGFVYTGSATIPKSRLEAFTRAAETLHVTVPTFAGPSTFDLGNYQILSSSDNHRVDDCSLDNVKIEESTSINDTRYLGCEQYPSYEGWLNSSSWHYDDDCAKRDIQRDDWIITSNDELEQTLRGSSNYITRYERNCDVATRHLFQDNGKSSSSFRENAERIESEKINFHDEKTVKTHLYDSKMEKIGCRDEKTEINHYLNSEITRKNNLNDKQLVSAGSCLENHSTIVSTNFDACLVDSSKFRETRENDGAFDFGARPVGRNFSRINGDQSLNSFSTCDNNSVSRNSLESWRGYKTREEKDGVDNYFEGGPAASSSESVASSLLMLHPTNGLRTTSPTFEKQDYDVSLPTINPRPVRIASCAPTHLIGGKSLTETAVSSTVTSEIAANFANSTYARANYDLCGESCCGWTRPKRHVANRVPASPWCQLARPAHHSPKTRPIVLRNRDEIIETPTSSIDWNSADSIISVERGSNCFSPKLITHIDNNTDNTSSLPLNLRSSVKNDSSGSIYDFKVPKRLEIPTNNDDNIDKIEKSRSPQFYDETWYKKLTIFPETRVSSNVQLSSRISSNEIIRSTEKFISRVDTPHRQSFIRQKDDISISSSNHEQQSRVKISQQRAITNSNEQIIINDTWTCNNLDTSPRIQLSHPISRLCDSVRTSNESNSREQFFMVKNTIASSTIRDIDEKEEDTPSFIDKTIFSINDGIVQSDDNNNEAGIDNSVVDNVTNVHVNLRERENEIIEGEDGAGSNEEHRCDQCGKTFVTRASLKVHGRTHSGEKPFRCNDCGKEFSQLRNYKYHRSVHEGTREFAATCPECGKYFNDRGYLSSHMKIHRNRKEYACSECGKSFNQRVAYNMHVRIHTGVKPHQCDQCGKAFSRKMLLKQHLRTHSGERPYQCQICHKAFADRSNMTLHTRLHSGLKPYQCTLCSKAFTKKHHLKTHLNYHTGTKPYSCPNCSITFSQSSNMRTHYKKCCSIGPMPIDTSSSARQPSTTANTNNSLAVERAPSRDNLLLSRIIESTSLRGRTNALTPPNSDQESSIKTAINLNDSILRSLSPQTSRDVKIISISDT